MQEFESAILSVLGCARIHGPVAQCNDGRALCVGSTIQQTGDSASFLTGGSSLHRDGLCVLIQPDHRAVPAAKVGLRLRYCQRDKLVLLHGDQPVYGFDQAGQPTDQLLSASALGVTNIVEHALQRLARCLLRRLGHLHLVLVHAIGGGVHLARKLALLAGVGGGFHGGGGLRVRVLQVIGPAPHILDRLPRLVRQVALTLFDAVKLASLLGRQLVR